MIRKTIKILFLAYAIISGVIAQPKYEFRAAWVGTVGKLDWPVSYETDEQKEELTDMLDGMESANMNAVIFQVRPSCDVFYDSEIEPWSNWLTGTEGNAPSPYYDPLHFAVEESHKRNMELHAWFNPYRVKKSTWYSNGVHSDHVYKKHPEWILSSGSDKKSGLIEENYYGLDSWGLEKNPTEVTYYLNPGLQEVRDYVLSVIMEVVNNYNIDGIHMDDYFYPYSGITNEDQQTFEDFPRGFTNIHDWRRDNVNLLIAAIHDSINIVKSHVKFGMSPFGIWKNGVPAGIVGTDAYNTIYCDPINWLNNQYIDYITPQLYWEFGGGQDYGKLMPWWADKAMSNERHLYTGNAPYRIGDWHNWSANELPRQIRLNRDTDGCQGNVYFRVNFGVLDNPKGFLDSLENDFYQYQALAPQMFWIDSIAPNAPQNLEFSQNGDDHIITWDKPTAASDGDTATRFVLYQDLFKPVNINKPENIIRIIDGRLDSISVTDLSIGHLALTSLDRLNNESEAINVGEVSIDVPSQLARKFQLLQNYPNPFNPTTTIPFIVEKRTKITLAIYDINGRKISDIIDDQEVNAGKYEFNFHASGIPSGVYFYRLQTDNFMLNKKMLLLK
ncbi:glycoside hydrolase [Candidatus Woesearchaeota archaeon]|nr:MAG: glycoside hydrolase [Candidatus Woesearchaeota archaeon]